MQAVHWYSLLTKSLGEDCLGQPLRPLPAGSPLRAWHASDAGLDSLSWPFPPGIVERLPAKQHGVLALWFDGVWRFCPQSDVDPRPAMLVQERGNFVVWNLRYRADSTAHQQMQMTTTRGLRAFPLVVPQKPCWKTCVWIRTTLWMVKGERWSESSQIQQAISTLLDACDVRCQSRRTFNNSPSAPHQHSKCFSERLSRYHRGRRLDERAERFRTYVEDMQSLMR